MNMDVEILANSIWLPVLIFIARVTDVSLGTMRLICVTRGRPNLAVILGFFEVLIWVLAVSGTFAHLDRWINILAFAAGFATGSAVGIWIEKFLAIGTQVVQFISCGSAQAVAEGLRLTGWRITSIPGSGRNGPVAICMAIVPRRATPQVIAQAKRIDPDVLITIEDTTITTLGRLSTPLPGKMPSVLAGGMRVFAGIRSLGSLRQRQVQTEESAAAA